MALRKTRYSSAFLAAAVLVLLLAAPALGQAEEEYEPIDSDACANCHEENSHGSPMGEDLAHSVHELLEKVRAVEEGASLGAKDIEYCIETAQYLPQAVEYA